MAIKIEYDRICIGSFVLCEDANGVRFDGKACANQFENTLSGARGSTFGFAAGGTLPPAPFGASTGIDKFPFSADTPASDAGDLLVCRDAAAGNSSKVSGYISGGRETNYPPFSQQTNRIDKFPFSVGGPSTDVGDLIVARRGVAANPSSTHGYTSGGVGNPVQLQCNIIDKFPFSADTNATDVGNLICARMVCAGQSSDTTGYITGGWTEPGRTSYNFIEKFPFATDTNSTDIGNLTQSRSFSGGHSSETHGYTAAGRVYPPYPGVPLDTIDKFPFSSDTDATDVAEVTGAQEFFGGAASSTQNGYMFNNDTIHKYSFAVDSDSVDVGEMSQARNSMAGTEI